MAGQGAACGLKITFDGSILQTIEYTVTAVLGATYTSTGSVTIVCDDSVAFISLDNTFISLVEQGFDKSGTLGSYSLAGLSSSEPTECPITKVTVINFSE